MACTSSSRISSEVTPLAIAPLRCNSISWVCPNATSIATVALADELSSMMAYLIAGLAAAVVPEQTTAMHHPEITYARLADHSSSLVSSIVAVHRPRVDPAVTRLLDLLTSQ